jgi:hypothetical protein
MNVASDYAYDFGGIDVLHTYACRVARRLLLKSSCDEDHPVLAIEEHLIEMAKSRLQEFLLASFPEDPSIMRLSAIVAVKRVAASKIQAADIDLAVKKELLGQLDEMPMDDLIPQVH